MGVVDQNDSREFATMSKPMAVLFGVLAAGTAMTAVPQVPCGAQDAPTP